MKSNTFHSGLRPMDNEFSYQVNRFEGEWPSWLRGSFFRNGPGRLQVGTTRMGHWFDGDGMVCAFRFRDSGVFFQNRYVRTPKFIRETALNRVDCRGFGTRRPGGLLANLLRPPANPANTSVVWQGEKLLALNEGGRPFALDPHSLETLGEYTFGDQLKPYNTFSAHGKILPATGRYFNFGVSVAGIGLQGAKIALTLYDIQPDGQLVKKTSVPVGYFPFCHDCAVTTRHAVFFLGSIRINHLGSVILGTRTIAESIAYEKNQPMRILVIDLETHECVLDLETDPGAVIHCGNAFEQDGMLNIDTMYIDNFDANEALGDIGHAEKLGGGLFRRYGIDLASGAVSFRDLSGIECEFPQWDLRCTGKKNRYTWCAAVTKNGNDSFFNSLLRVDAKDCGAGQLLELPPGLFASEPVFVPTPGSDAEDDGVILDVIYNANTGCSELWVMDASQIDRVIAKAFLDHHIPHQFHGCYVAGLE